MAGSQSAEAVPSEGRPGFWDWIFLCALALSLVVAISVGVLAYGQGQRTEDAKRLGEAWLKWLGDHAALRFEPEYGHEHCAGTEKATWGPCLAWLTGPQGPMADQSSAFSGDLLQVLTKCDASDRGLAGMLALEQIVTLPPGAAVPTVTEPLAQDTSIEKKILIRVTVCAKDGSPIRVGETEF